LSTNSENKKGDLIDVLFNGSVYKNDAEKVLCSPVVREIPSKHIANELIAKISAESARGHAEQAKLEKKKQLELQKVPCKQSNNLSNMSHEIVPKCHHWIYKGDYGTDLTTKQNEYLNAIKLSGDALIVLIDDILDLAKVDSGK
jgi:signal transduction histidine kinase